MLGPSVLSRALLGAAVSAIAIASTVLGQSRGAGDSANDAHRVAIFAGGCFWCVESDFDEVPGVVATNPGYAGGHVEEPTYEQVSAGGTGHREAVEIIYDPERVSYAELLHIFWRSIDPTDPGGQFCDRGHSYTTAIFPVDARQRELAAESKRQIQEGDLLDKPVVTEIADADTFYRAERYHQDFHVEHPIHYKAYRYLCGRDSRVEDLWGNEAYDGIPGK